MHSSPTHDALTFKLSPWVRDFNTQALDLTQIKFLRIWVRGAGIAERLWNAEGYVSMANGQALQIAKIPKGKNRVVTAQGYDANQQLIPGATLKAFYDSPLGNNTITVHLKWRFVPVGELLEQLLDLNVPFLQNMDATALQATMDQMLYGQNPAGGNTFAVHPSLVEASAVTSNLMKDNGLISPTILSQALKKTGTATIVIRTPQGNLLNTPVTVSLNDPASTVVTVPAGGTGTATIPNLAPGTWRARAQMASPSGPIQVQTTVTVAQDGTVTLGAGTPGNPLVPPPLITDIQAGPLHGWAADGNANDAIGNMSGTLVGGTTFAPGKIGQAFRFDGATQYVDIGTTFTDQIETKGSIAAWVYRTGNAGGIFTRSTGTGWPDERLVIYFRSDNNTWGWSFANGVTFQAQAWPNTTFPANQWVHVVLSWDGTTVNTYLNGALHNSQAQTVVPEISGIKTRLGWTEGLAGQFLQGQIDDLKVYNRTVSATEATALYNRTPLRDIVGDAFDTVLANNTVKFGGPNATVLTASPTRLVVSVPTNISGTVAVTNTTGAGTSNPFNLNLPPVVTGLSMPIAFVGDTVTISGFGFDPTPANNTVQFNGVSASVTAATPTSLTVTVPVGTTTGYVTVSHAGGTAMGPTFSPVPTGLISWWQGENNANDRQGINPGNMINTATFLSGQVGQAFSFDGIAGRLEMPHSASLSLTGDYTINFWAKPAATQNASSEIFRKEDVVQNNGYGLEMTGAANSNQYLAGWKTPAFGFQCWGAVSLNLAPDTFQYVSLSKAGMVLNAYINGNLISTCTGTNATMGTNTAPLQFGAWSVIPGREWKGLLDEITMFNRALSLTEIQTIFNASK